MFRLTHGVGINDRTRPTTINDHQLREYMAWKSMMARCYSPLVHKRSPSYIGCEVSENFKHYSYFYEWARKQIGFYIPHSELDKDLLIKDNKIYSEDNCVFLPPCLNMVKVRNVSMRGKLPIGVSFNKKMGKYKVCCRNGVGESRKYLGYYDKIEDAFQAYKNYKEEYIKQLANIWKEKIDPRAYDALMRYEVEITD